MSTDAGQQITLQISKEEWATMLAALRYWQQQMDCAGTTARTQIRWADNTMPDFFSDREMPLTVKDIDELCERLNTERGRP